MRNGRRWFRGKNFQRKIRRRRRPVTLNIYCSRNPAYRAWKKAVHTRDAYTCQLCQKHQRRHLHAHHIRRKSLHPELAFDPTNGTSLCKRCHHKIVDRHEEVFEHLFELAIEAGHPLPYSIFVWFNSLLLDVNPTYCECGCTGVTRVVGRKVNRFIKGHRKGRKLQEVAT